MYILRPVKRSIGLYTNIVYEYIRIYAVYIHILNKCNVNSDKARTHWRRLDNRITIPNNNTPYHDDDIWSYYLSIDNLCDTNKLVLI